MADEQATSEPVDAATTATDTSQATDTTATETAQSTTAEETIDWKKEARKHEARAKENAKAAEELEKIRAKNRIAEEKAAKEAVDAILEFLDEYWTADEQGMPLFKKLGLLEQAKIAACISMIESGL